MTERAGGRQQLPWPYMALVGTGAQSSFPRNWILIATVEVGPIRYHQLTLFLQEQVKIFIKNQFAGLEG